MDPESIPLDLLVLDDWGLTPFTGGQDQDMLEIIEDRHGQRSTIITSQVPVDSWHALMTNPTVADAILEAFAWETALTVTLPVGGGDRGAV